MTHRENPFSVHRVQPGSLEYLFPGDTVPGSTVPDDTVPGNTVPADTSPGDTSSGNTSPGNTDIAGLIDTLAGNGWWGEIVGPHGSGKTTLLATLMPRLGERGFAVVHLQFRMGEQRLARDWASGAADDSQVIVVVDGMEQLGWLARRRIRRDCRRRGWGLVATAHTSLGLPALYRTEFDLRRFEHVVGQLLADEDWTVDCGQLQQIHERFAGDMREMLFCLYDLYEAQ